MNNSSKSGLVGVLSFLVLTAASLGILGAASRTASASSGAIAASGVVRDGGEPAVETVWTIDEVQVTGSAPRRAAAPRARAAAPVVAAPRHCEGRDLEQGGTFRPDLSSGMSGVVIVCS